MRSLDILIEAFRYFATRFDAGYRIKLEYVLGALSRALTRATLKVQLEILDFFETFEVNKYGELRLVICKGVTSFTCIRAGPQVERGRLTKLSIVDD